MVAKTFHIDTVNSIISILKLLTSKPQYITIFYSTLEGGSEYDLFAKALLSFCNASGSTMEILKNVITSEFDSNANTPTSIMRGNTASSRILGLFCRQQGSDYLRNILSPIIGSIVGNDSVDFEIDISKLESQPDVHKSHLEQLIDYTEKVLATISKPDSILAMPRDIKALAYHIYQLALKYSAENTMLLVGGFVMLRFINPALINPDYFNVVQDCTLNMKDRRNLTLLCKVVQNISNQRLCNEDWMLDCNPYLENNLHRLEEYYKHVIMDPNQESADQQPFADLFRVYDPESIEVNPHAIDFSAYQFFDEIFSDRKARLLEILSELPHEDRISPISLELLELLNDYGEAKPQQPQVLDLYYSPLCPFSRAVWFFCLENELPVNAHKIDLLKEDQGLDQAYKSFAKLSRNLQVPLLIDGNFVLEESDAICLYLADRVFLANHWVPKADWRKMGIIHQQLDWMQDSLLPGVLQLWDACKNPSSEAFQTTQHVEFLKQLDILDQVYAREHLRNHFPSTEVFLQGEKPCLVDLFAVFIMNFAQLIQGYSINRYPHLKNAFNAFTRKYQNHWKQINYEFEGFFKYIITATITESLPQITHSVLFQESPHTIYEMLLDPENDIFLYLASKTISTKTNAKLKQGLKKLNTDPHTEPSGGQPEETQAPYIVNLEIGGEFNLRGREGKNLLLVPGRKIVQVSRMSDWPSSHTATQIFSLKKTRDGKTLLHFTEINCPEEYLKAQDDHWCKFWKKINGVRVDSFRQTVFFKSRIPSQLSSLLTDWKLLSKTLKFKIKEDDPASALKQSTTPGSTGAHVFNNKIYVRTISASIKSILQEFRGIDWAEGVFADLQLDMEPFEGGTTLSCLFSLVPYDRLKPVEKLWKSNLWKKLSGVLCGTIEQRVNFRSTPEEVSQLYAEGSISAPNPLKGSRAQPPSNQAGAQFQVGHLKGNIVIHEPGKYINQRVSHKDWPTHPSVVIMHFTAIPSGCELHLEHRNIPFNCLKQTYDMWITDFWDKMEGVCVQNYSTSVLVNSIPPAGLYASLLDKDQLQTITGSECSIVPREEGAVSLYDKFVKGSILKLEENSMISMSLRDFNWLVHHQSEVEIKLEEFNNGKGSFVTLYHHRIPVHSYEVVAQRWQTFCANLKKLPH